MAALRVPIGSVAAMRVMRAYSSVRRMEHGKPATVAVSLNAAVLTAAMMVAVEAVGIATTRRATTAWMRGS